MPYAVKSWIRVMNRGTMNTKNKIFLILFAVIVSVTIIGLINKSIASDDNQNNKNHTNSTSVVKVLIFDGKGVMSTSVDGIEDCLNQSNQENLTPGIKFEYSTSTEINSKTLSGYDILILPGGEAPEYLQSDDINSADIKQFIDSGKGYLGICAGAYAASNRVDGLYSGWGLASDVNTKNVGYEGLLNLSTTSTGTNLINANTTTIMHDAGPAMYTNNTHTIMATYADNHTGYEGFAAIVEDNYGAGRVVLSGSHPEMDPKIPSYWPVC
jgi:glutamine amidotransferase-like uncharacterized protein